VTSHEFLHISETRRVPGGTELPARDNARLFLHRLHRETIHGLIHRTVLPALLLTVTTCKSHLDLIVSQMHPLKITILSAVHI
jgi:hypothetical protein